MSKVVVKLSWTPVRFDTAGRRLKKPATYLVRVRPWGLGVGTLARPVRACKARLELEPGTYSLSVVGIGPNGAGPETPGLVVVIGDGGGGVDVSVK